MGICDTTVHLDSSFKYVKSVVKTSFGDGV